MPFHQRRLFSTIMTKRTKVLKAAKDSEIVAAAVADTTKETSSSSKSLSRSLEKSVATGYNHIIGLDEAGRGPLAGPVVAAACYLPEESGILSGIADSKLLSEDDREKAFVELESNPLVQYAYCVVSHTEIDEINILQASMTAMSRSTSALLAGMGILPTSAIHATTSLKSSLMTPELDASMKNKSASKIKTVTFVKNASFSSLKQEDFVGLVDGNRIPTDLPIEGRFVIQGDRKIYSIAAASIIAKVIRDRIMVELDKKYPIYMFAQHKGYPTFAHRSLLIEHGPCEVHRRTYGPVKEAILAQERRNNSNNQSKAVESATGSDQTSKKRKRSTSDKPVEKFSKKSTSAEALNEKAIKNISNNYTVPPGVRRSARLASKD